MSAKPPAEVADLLQKAGVRQVECLFPDVTGYPRGKLMPAAAFLAGQELRIAQAIPMQAVTGEYSYDPIFPDDDPDVRLVPDMTTVRLAPWAPAGQPRALADGGGLHRVFALAGRLSCRNGLRFPRSYGRRTCLSRPGPLDSRLATRGFLPRRASRRGG